MIIRHARDLDRPEILAIYNYEVAHSTAAFDTVCATLDSRQSWFDEHKSAKHPILVADAGEHIAGWASLSPWSDRCAYARAAEVSVYIGNSYRRQGIGRSLLQALIDSARANELGVLLARISCGEGPASRTLHESVGFRLVGTMRRVGVKFGRVLDVDLLDYHIDENNIP